MQRWRLLHAGWQDDIFLELEEHTLHSIARDGIPLVRMGLMMPRSTEQTDDNPNALLMAPAQRIDVLVQAGKPGSYRLRAVPYNQGYASPTGPIARIVVEGDPLPMRLPARLPPPPPWKPITDDEITGRRTLVFSAIYPEAPLTYHWPEFSFMVDGKIFDHNRVDQRVRLGAVRSVGKPALDLTTSLR